jgi:hypothetical protein
MVDGERSATWVFFDKRKPKDDNKVTTRYVCYGEFRHFSGIKLKPGEAVRLTVDKRFRWEKT